MRRRKMRPMYFEVSCLHDGTVLAAYPVRKPTPHVIKRDHLRIDDDNVCKEFSRNGQELRDATYEGRTRFQDIIANRLNVHRALRTIVLPRIEALENSIEQLQMQLDRIEQAVNKISTA